MTDERLSLGRKGEELARRYLLERGYRIVVMNYRGKLGEIDLVAEDGDTLVFVEVKTRRGNALGDPLEGIDRRKQRQIIKAAREYLMKHDCHERICRFDGIGVLLAPNGQARVELVKGAFEAGP